MKISKRSRELPNDNPISDVQGGIIIRNELITGTVHACV